MGYGLLTPALARRRFRLAGQGIALMLVWWFSELRVVSGWGGRPNGIPCLQGCALAGGKSGKCRILFPQSNTSAAAISILLNANSFFPKSLRDAPR